MTKPNIIKSTDIDGALSVEFIRNFKGDYDRLAEILGIFGVTTRAAGFVPVRRFGHTEQQRVCRHERRCRGRGQDLLHP